jgi:DNA-directed RNA polymerase specialized sigma24 family protein
VATERADQVHALLRDLPARQREVLDVRDVDGETHSNHFYLSVVADRR